MTSDEPRDAGVSGGDRSLVPGRIGRRDRDGRRRGLRAFCAQAGATRVYAIESSEERTNPPSAASPGSGFEDRVVVSSRRFDAGGMPERGDVCVSEIIGSIASAEGAAVILNDARRFLKPDGVMIPRRWDTHRAASFPDEAWRGAGFSLMSADYLGRIFRAVGQRFDMRLCLKNVDGTRSSQTSGVLKSWISPAPFQAIKGRRSR